MKLNDNQRNVLQYVWHITNILILIIAVLLLFEGGTVNIIVAVIGIAVVVCEVLFLQIDW